VPVPCVPAGMPVAPAPRIPRHTGLPDAIRRAVAAPEHPGRLCPGHRFRRRRGAADGLPPSGRPRQRRRSPGPRPARAHGPAAARFRRRRRGAHGAKEVRALGRLRHPLPRAICPGRTAGDRGRVTGDSLQRYSVPRGSTFGRRVLSAPSPHDGPADVHRPAGPGAALPADVRRPALCRGEQPRAVRAQVVRGGGRDDGQPPRRRAHFRARPAPAGAGRPMGRLGERRGRRGHGGPREPRPRAAGGPPLHPAARVAHAPRHPPLLPGLQQPVSLAPVPPAAGPDPRPRPLLGALPPREPPLCRRRAGGGAGQGGGRVDPGLPPGPGAPAGTSRFRRSTSFAWRPRRATCCAGCWPTT
jgi:hypothetical protein